MSVLCDISKFAWVHVCDAPKAYSFSQKAYSFSFQFTHRLCPYMRGMHHLEEIMYYENVSRSQLHTLLDKFKDVLVTCRHQDAASVQYKEFLWQQAMNCRYWYSHAKGVWTLDISKVIFQVLFERWVFHGELVWREKVYDSPCESPNMDCWVVLSWVSSKKSNPTILIRTLIAHHSQCQIPHSVGMFLQPISESYHTQNAYHTHYVLCVKLAIHPSHLRIVLVQNVWSWSIIFLWLHNTFSTSTFTDEKTTSLVHRTSLLTIILSMCRVVPFCQETETEQMLKSPFFYILSICMISIQLDGSYI